MATEKNCKKLVRGAYNSRMADIRKLWELYRSDMDASDPDLGNWNEYGLSWDYVAPGTFDGQRRGYFRYQISYGGPSDEFRFFVDERLQITRVEYWHMDWFDGAKVNVTGRNLELWNEIWSDLLDCECPQNWMKQAQQ